MSGRIRLLVAVHASLVLVQFVPLLSHGLNLPLLWIPGAVLIGQNALLGLWLGLGATRFWKRLPAAAVGCAFLVAWFAWAMIERDAAFGNASEQFAEIFPLLYGAWFGLVILTALVAALFRIKFVLSQAPSNDAQQGLSWRFSMLGMLTLASLGTVLMSMVRTRPGEFRGPVIEYAFSLFVLALDVVCAVWATLSRGRVGERIAVAFLVAVLLSFTQAFSNQVFHASWWLFAAQGAIFVIPTIVVIASLLVVRSCGYRLLSKAGLRLPDAPAVPRAAACDGPGLSHN